MYLRDLLQYFFRTLHQDLYFSLRGFRGKIKSTMSKRYPRVFIRFEAVVKINGFVEGVSDHWRELKEILGSVSDPLK